MNHDVSIVVPTYNAAPWIAETLSSAATPTALRTEVIVVDDGSTDDTETVVKTSAPWARYIRTANRGVSAARATGTQAASGRYLKYLDADDLLVPGSLERQVSLAESSATDVVYGNWQRLCQVDQNWQPGETIARSWQDVSSDPEVAFFTAMWSPTASYLWSRAFLANKHPGWHIGLPVIQDARFALDAARAGARFEHDAAPSVLYRTHQTGSVSTQSRLAFLRDSQRNALEIEGIWLRSPSLSEIRRAALLSVWSWLTRAAYRTNRPLFRECWNHLRGLEPKHIPEGGQAFRTLARLAGYPAAEFVSALRTQGAAPCSKMWGLFVAGSASGSRRSL